jgi:hypothetical protein
MFGLAAPKKKCVHCGRTSKKMDPPPCKNCHGTEWHTIGTIDTTLLPAATPNSNLPSTPAPTSSISTKTPSPSASLKRRRRLKRPPTSSTFTEWTEEEEQYVEDDDNDQDPWRAMFSKTSRVPLRKTLQSMMVTPDIPPITDMLVYETKRWIYIFGCSDVSVLMGGGTGLTEHAQGTSATPSNGTNATNGINGTQRGASKANGGSSSSSSNRTAPVVSFEKSYEFIKISRRDDLNDTTKQQLNEIVTFDSHTYTRTEARTLLATLATVAASEGDQLTGPTMAISIIGTYLFVWPTCVCS